MAETEAQAREEEFTGLLTQTAFLYCSGPRAQGGTIRSELGSLASILNQEKAQQLCLQANFMESFFSIEVPSSYVTLDCTKLTKH